MAPNMHLQKLLSRICCLNQHLNYEIFVIEIMKKGQIKLNPIGDNKFQK